MNDIKAKFEAADTNNDGGVDLQEYHDWEDDKEFTKSDINGDGVVTAQEAFEATLK